MRVVNAGEVFFILCLLVAVAMPSLSLEVVVESASVVDKLFVGQIMHSWHRLAC